MFIPSPIKLSATLASYSVPSAIFFDITWPRYPATRKGPSLFRRFQSGRPLYPTICLIALAAGVLLTGCKTERGDGRPPGRTETVYRQDTRLVFDIPTLAFADLSVRKFRDQTGVRVEEVGEWVASSEFNVIAGLVLSESSAGPPLTDPQDPEDIAQLWAVFGGQKASFGKLQQGQNLLGPALWRRMSVGTRACVAFLQRWTFAAHYANEPVTSLSGYYCNPPGRVLAPELAESVIRAVGIKPTLAPLQPLQPLPPLPPLPPPPGPAATP
jgi:hypothetical protein